MKRSYLIGAFCFALLLVIGSGWAGPLDSVAPYVGGEWRIDGAWKAGEPIKGRELFTWGVGKKFIIIKTLINTPKGEYERYQTIFGEQDGKLMAWSFAFDGHADANEFKIDGKKLSSTKLLPAEDGAAGSTLHQSIELTDPNQFRWLVSIEKNGKDDPIMDGLWMRTQEITKDAKVVFPKNETTADDKLLDPIVPMIGNWHIKTKWSDGNELSATKSYEWGPGKKFIVCRTTILKPDGTVDYERYYTLFGVHDGKLTQYNFIHDGNIDFAPQTIDGKRVGGVRTFKHDGSETKVNQFTELTDPNTLHWKVWNDADGPDKPMMDANWVRDESK